MLYLCGATQQGRYHAKKNQVCQDAYQWARCSDRLAVAAVADGLGSELHAEIASRLAADLSVQYCAERVKESTPDEEVLHIIHEAFSLAQDRIEETARQNGHDLDQYDTTLSLVVFREGRVYYGHSGDGGIIAYTQSGLYKLLTTQQRDQEGRVFPLFFREEKWVFGRAEEKIASVLLATDGILKLFFPVYIRHQPVSIYVALARFWMDRDALDIEKRGEAEVQRELEGWMESLSEEQVDDDKTMVILVDSEASVTLQPAAYYQEPDWTALIQAYREEWEREAYPHLYQKQGGGQVAGPSGKS